MKSPNKGGSRVPFNHFLSPKEASTEIRLHLIQLLAKRVHGIPKLSKLLSRLYDALHQLTAWPIAEGSIQITH